MKSPFGHSVKPGYMPCASLYRLGLVIVRTVMPKHGPRMLSEISFKSSWMHKGRRVDVISPCTGAPAASMRRPAQTCCITPTSHHTTFVRTGKENYKVPFYVDIHNMEERDHIVYKSKTIFSEMIARHITFKAVTWNIGCVIVVSKLDS